MSDSPTNPRSTWAPLKNRNFLTLLVGTNLSGWGDAIYSIALLWFVYQDTHSVFGTAVVSAIQRLGNVLGGPIAGVYVDRWDRRRTLLGVTGVNMAVVLVLALLAFYHVLTVWPIYVVVLLLSAIAMVTGPAFHSIMSRILPRDDLASGNGLYESVGAANGFFRSAVGGVVVAAVGAATSFFLDVGSFVFALAAYWRLKLPPDPPHPAEDPGRPTPRGRFWRELGAGWASLRQNRLLMLLAVWAFIGTLGGGAMVALLPVVVFRTLHGGPAILGLVEAAPLVGSVMGGLTAGWVSRRLSVGQVLILSGALMGLGAAGFALSHSLWWGLPLWAVTGLGQTAMNSAFNAFFQATVPPALMGRTFGILGAIENAAGPISAAAAGALGGVWGAGVVMAAGGLWMALSGILLLFNRPAMAARMTEAGTAG